MCSSKIDAATRLSFFLSQHEYFFSFYKVYIVICYAFNIKVSPNLRAYDNKLLYYNNLRKKPVDAHGTHRLKITRARWPKTLIFVTPQKPRRWYEWEKYSCDVNKHVIFTFHLPHSPGVLEVLDDQMNVMRRVNGEDFSGMFSRSPSWSKEESG
jgi:hypothetical protein